MNKPLLAITGPNGTIGHAALLYALRTNKYRIRCIARSFSAIETLKQSPSIKEHINDIEFMVVEDNTLPDAYDKALEGVAYVIHIAGVWPMPDYHPDNDIWYPFVRSMENMLFAARKSGTVKRIVFTQAGAALVDPGVGDTLGTGMDGVLDEYVSLNEHISSLRPPLPSPHHAYSAAKAYCMTHLRTLQQAGTLPFSIIQIIPGTVIGPSPLVTSSSEAYAKMDRMSKALLFDAEKPRYAFGFVHVDDCARVHVEALDEEVVPRERVPDWFVAAGSTARGKTAEEIWKEVGEMVEGDFGREVEGGVFRVGWGKVPINMPFKVDSRKTEELLLGGGEFRSLRDCVKEVAGWYVGLLEREREGEEGVK